MTVCTPCSPRSRTSPGQRCTAGFSGMESHGYRTSSGTSLSVSASSATRSDFFTWISPKCRPKRASSIS
jgi:hypothetical protein